MQAISACRCLSLYRRSSPVHIVSLARRSDIGLPRRFPGFRGVSGVSGTGRATRRRRILGPRQTVQIVIAKALHKRKKLRIPRSAIVVLNPVRLVIRVPTQTFRPEFPANRVVCLNRAVQLLPIGNRSGQPHIIAAKMSKMST